MRREEEKGDLSGLASRNHFDFFFVFFMDGVFRFCFIMGWGHLLLRSSDGVLFI